MKQKRKNNIEISARYLTSLKDKSLGLLTSEIPDTIYFQTHFGIHTFGMKYPIDVVICDKNFIVVSLKKILSPNKIFLWNLKYNNVIELSGGEIEKKNIAIGASVVLKKKH